MNACNFTNIARVCSWDASNIFRRLNLILLNWLSKNHALNKVTEKNEASSAISEVYRSMRDLTWSIRQIPFIFLASFLLAKENERFIFLGIFCNLLVQSFLNFQSRVGCFVKIIRNDQRQNIVSIPLILVTPLTVVIRMKDFGKYLKTQSAEDTSPGRIQVAPLSWLNFVTSHSSWEASKIKSSKQTGGL